MTMITRRPPAATLLAACLIVSLLAGCDMSALTPGPTSAPSRGSGSGNTGNTYTGNNVAGNPGGGLPAQAQRPQPPQNTFGGCPSTGDGGDRQLNVRKNRTDSAAWYPVAIASILSLNWPKSIQGQQRQRWSPADAAEVARYEGIPVQVEGWLAGAKQQGPESCNCHAVDQVDYHLWIVDAPSKDRSQSVVVEITPRLRATHPGWAIERIRPLVDGRTKVRISGWLMMDQEHPDQIGKTRGTIWEVHPIIAFDVQRGNGWVSLDTGRASDTTSNAVPPTEDPSLPPPITDPFQGADVPTPSPRPAAGRSGGRSTSGGPVGITDIFYNGAINPSEPDEYVEIANNGPNPVNMDGWTLRDLFGGQEFTWHGFTIQPGQKTRVYTNQAHQETGGFSFGSSQAIWANKGDAAELLDASGTVVSSFSYGDKQ